MVLELLQYFALGVAVAMPIGAMITEAIKRAAKHGFFSGFLVAIGTLVSDFVYLALIFFGLSSFIQIPWIQTVMLLFGFFVLAYLGLQSIIEFFKGHEIEVVEMPSRRNSLVTGIVLGFSSPYILVWWIGIFGSMMATVASPYLMLANGFAIIAGIICWEGFLLIVVSQTKKKLSEKIAKYISGISGVVLLVFAAQVGYTLLTQFL